VSPLSLEREARRPHKRMLGVWAAVYQVWWEQTRWAEQYRLSQLT